MKVSINDPSLKLLNSARSKTTHRAPRPISFQVQDDVLAEIITFGNDRCYAYGMPLKPAYAGHIEIEKLGGFHLSNLHDGYLRLASTKTIDVKTIWTVTGWQIQVIHTLLNFSRRVATEWFAVMNVHCTPDMIRHCAMRKATSMK